MATEPSAEFRKRIEVRLADGKIKKGSVDLHGCGIDESSIDWVIARVKKLVFDPTWLDIGGNLIREIGARKVVKAFPKLEVLYISFNDIREGGAQAIAGGLPRLRQLSISTNGLHEGGARAVASLDRLTWLDINFNNIGNPGARAVADGLPELTRLHIAGNAMSAEGATAIANAAKLPKLMWLGIDHNEIGDRGVLAIANELPGLEGLSIAGTHIRHAAVVVYLLQQLIPTSAQALPGAALTFIRAADNPLRWFGKAEIDNELLEEPDPVKLLELLNGLRGSSTTLSVAGIAFIGRSGSGKTHAARWTVAHRAEYRSLRGKLDSGDGTWGYDRYERMLGPDEHKQKSLGNVCLIAIDVGGHREQLNSANNLVYVNARRSVFVLVIKASKTFDEDGWARYHLRLIQQMSLRRRKASYLQYGPNDSHVAAGGLAPHRIPVVILVTHTDEVSQVVLPAAVTLASDFPLIDVVSVTKWEAPQGDKYLPALHKQLGTQLRKVEHLQGENVHFIVPLMKAISALFELGDRSEAVDWHGRQSVSVDEFRIICETLNGRTKGEQDAAVRALESFGYVARSSGRLDPATRLLNPRFINCFLFQRVIREGRKRAKDGFMPRSLLNELLESIQNAEDRKGMLRVMKECLIMFEWREGSNHGGYFVPDLLPVRSSVPSVPPKVVLYQAEYQPAEFLSEDCFFKLLAARRKWLRVAESVRLPDGEIREIKLFRDQCVLGDAGHFVEDKYHARLTVDVIAEWVRVAVVGEGGRGDAAGAEAFAGRVLGWLEDEAGCEVNRVLAEDLTGLVSGVTSIPTSSPIVDPTQYVTKWQLAMLVKKSTKTLDRALARTRNPMPQPDVPGGGGRAAEWIYTNVRDWLVEEYGKFLPVRYPGGGGH